MAAQKGSSFLLKDNSGGSAVVIGGLRSTSMTINGEIVDITAKDSATFTGSSGHDIGRALGSNMGIRSMSVSASGVFTDSAGENNLRGAAFTGSSVNYDLVFGDGSTVKGAFIITSYERAGEYNGEETFSVTLESNGTMTYTNA
jgi:TP901-1 family phage major tail protein|tara:strand:- start:445 stop:876 length:432 start_codon:yes stop_codon:yes gene_type:complete